MPIFHGCAPSSEATSFALANSQAVSNSSFEFFISHHGDSYNKNYIGGLTNIERELLNELMRNDGISKSPPLIVICHSEPGAWHAPQPNYHTVQCPAANALYKIGRTMFETDLIPSVWVVLNRKNECGSLNFLT